MKGQHALRPGAPVHARQGFLKNLLPVSLACSILMSAMPMALAGPGDVNSTNTNSEVQGGTYFNTPGSRTTFQNDTSLWLKSGALVRGIESDINKVPTGNGGTLYFRAPMVRLDGDIDVSAILKSNGTYAGNGGKVFIDSSYLMQTGNIFANGFNGGLVQFNVGAATIAPGAKIEAQGFGGNGGTININSPGIVDIQRSAVIDTSGKVIGTIDTNVINIEGSVVNNEGVIRANGLALVDGRLVASRDIDASLVAANSQLNSKPAPGPISGGTGQNVIMGEPVEFVQPGPTTERGGTVRIVATGQNYSTTAKISASNVFTADEKTAILDRQAALLRNEGDIVNTGTFQAKGSAGNDGGTVLLAASDDVHNYGTIDVKGGNGTSTASGNGTNGGNGGTVFIAARDAIINHGFIEATGGNGGNASSINVSTGNGQDAVADASGNVAGRGGDGGVMVFSYNTMEHKGAIIANGGVGGIGGNANAFDSEVAPTADSDATARATAIGGQGGQGGNGGLAVFSGNGNPTGGTGLVMVNGGRGGRGGNVSADARAVARNGDPFAVTNTTAGAAGLGGARGTVVAPNASQFPFDLTYRAAQGGPGNSGTQQRTRILTKNGTSTVQGEFISAIGGATAIGDHNTVQATRKNELVVHRENAFLISQAGGTGVVASTLSGRLNDVRVRTAANPLGVSGAAGVGLNSAKHAINFGISSTNANALNLDFANNNASPIFDKLLSLTILNNGNIDNGMHWAPGVQQVGPGFHDMTFAVGGGHHSWISSGSITNGSTLLTRGLWSGGSINLVADQNITNNKLIMDIAFNPHTASGYTRVPGYISSHAGSTILKAKNDITNNWLINNKEGFFDIHPGLDASPRPEWVRFMNAAQIGHTNYLMAGNNITNNVNGRISSEAITYRDGTVDQGANNPANAIGGILTLSAGGTMTNNGLISADAQSWFGTSGNFKFRTMTGLTEVSSTDGQVIIEE